MRIEITKNGFGSKVFDDDGNDLSEKMHLRAITVQCQANAPTRAIMEMIMVEAQAFNPAESFYSVGGHSHVKGVILEDDTIEFFPGKTGINWENELEDLCTALATHSPSTIDECAQLCRARRLLNRAREDNE